VAYPNYLWMQHWGCTVSSLPQSLLRKSVSHHVNCPTCTQLDTMAPPRVLASHLLLAVVHHWYSAINQTINMQPIKISIQKQNNDKLLSR
jgi:hypothetical protein